MIQRPSRPFDHHFRHVIDAAKGASKQQADEQRTEIPVEVHEPGLPSQARGFSKHKDGHPTLMHTPLSNVKVGDEIAKVLFLDGSYRGSSYTA